MSNQNYQIVSELITTTSDKLSKLTQMRGNILKRMGELNKERYMSDLYRGGKGIGGIAKKYTLLKNKERDLRRFWGYLASGNPSDKWRFGAPQAKLP